MFTTTPDASLRTVRCGCCFLKIFKSKRFSATKPLWAGLGPAHVYECVVLKPLPCGRGVRGLLLFGAANLLDYGVGYLTHGEATVHGGLL